MSPHIAGGLAYDVAHLLGGVALLLSFVLLYQRRVAAVVNNCAAQAVAVAAAAAWQGLLQRSPELGATALIVLAANAIAIPLALHRVARRVADRGAVHYAVGVFPSLAVGLALVALGILVTLPTAMPMRKDLALALSVVLLALLTMTTRRDAVTRTASFLALGNGLILAMTSMDGLALVVELSAAVMALVAAAVAGLVFFNLAHPHRASGEHR